jgi:hypothetical protein
MTTRFKFRKADVADCAQFANYGGVSVTSLNRTNEGDI